MQFVLHRNILDTWTLTQAVIFHFQFPFPFGGDVTPTCRACDTGVQWAHTHTVARARKREIRDKEITTRRKRAWCVFSQSELPEEGGEQKHKKKRGGKKKGRGERKGNSCSPVGYPDRKRRKCGYLPFFFSSSPTICLCASLIYLIRELRLKATAPNWHQLCVRGWMWDGCVSARVLTPQANISSVCLLVNVCTSAGV